MDTKRHDNINQATKYQYIYIDDGCVFPHRRRRAGFSCATPYTLRAMGCHERKSFPYYQAFAVVVAREKTPVLKLLL